MFILALVGLVGGLLAGVSPCVLPVLPVVFLSGGAQGSSPRRSYLVVAGLTLSFSLFTLFGSLLLRALHLPADVIRWGGLVALVLLGLAMLVPRLEELLTRPFSRLGAKAPGERGGFALGLALGAVYVPCAGPVLAAITVAGATGAIGVRTLVLTLSFAIGTAIPLLFFALAGRNLSRRLRVFRRHQRGVRVAGGVVVIALALALTFNLTDAVQRLIPDYTAAGANALAPGLKPADPNLLGACANLGASGTLSDCGPEPVIAGITQWQNSAPLQLASLRGSVVLVDFWAYSCINCQRAIAHVEAWYRTYRDAGLVVIGVHTPEYAFEKVPANVSAGAQRLGITYPVALDNDYTTWTNFGNDSWPADYVIDATGEVRYVYVGEGDYGGMESVLRQLLTAAHPGAQLPPATSVPDTTPTDSGQTPESYLGSGRANSYVYGQLEPGVASFGYPSTLPVNDFALTGTWDVADEALTARAGAGIELNFHAANVYLDVAGTGTLTSTVDGVTTTYQVSGAPNIYTVVHRTAPISALLRLTLSPGLSAYSFTFG